jgi:hypothetical protein
MAKKRKKEKEKNGVICPHCPESHPFGTQYCPTTGIQLSEELLDNEKLKTENKALEKKRWFHLKLNIFFSVFLILLIILVLVIIFGFTKDNIPGKGKEKPIEPIPGYLRSGGVTLIYQADPQYPQLVTDMVQAYLEQFGASGIKSTKESGDETIVKGVIPGKDKPVNAEIRLLALGKIKVAPGEEAGGAIEDLKKQLAAEKKKREDTENQLAAEKIEKQVIQNQLTGEQEKRRDVEAQFTQEKTKRETIESQLKEEKEKRRDVEEQLKEEKRRKNSSETQLRQEEIKRGQVDKQLMAEITKRKKLEEQLTEERKKNEEPKSKQTLNFLELQPEIKNDYESKLKWISGLFLPEGIDKVTGELNLVLAVNKNGTIMIQQFIHDYMNVSPKEKTNDTIQMISNRIRNIYLPIPRKRNNTPINIENWGLRYKVITFQGKVTLEVIK